MQVFVSPKGMKITRGHLKQALPGRALAAQYEPSTRVLALMFANEEGTAARLGFFSFDSEFMRLQVHVSHPAHLTSITADFRGVFALRTCKC